MKHLLLAAVAATSFLAVPAFAQSTGGVGSATPTDPGAKSPNTSTNTANGTMGGDMSAPAPAQPDPAMSQQAPMPAQSDPAMAGGTASTGGTMTTGGYMPSGPAMSGSMTPGATVQFRAAPSPSEAYPAPAPLASYPICKKGQYDKCMQRGGR